MMLAGEKPSECGACHKNESIGSNSFRKDINEKFSHHIYSAFKQTDSVTGFYPVKPWAYMDIRFSNKCNFKCRTCDPIHSHLWFADTKLNDGKPKLINLADTKNYPSEQIESSLSNVEEIYFAGGEPLILDEHYNILSKIIEQNRAKKVILSYSTNLSVINYKNYFK